MAEEDKALIVGPTEIKEDDDLESNKAGPSKAQKKEIETLYAEIRAQFNRLRNLIDQVRVRLERRNLGLEVTAISQRFKSLDSDVNNILNIQASKFYALRLESRDAPSSTGWAREDEKMHIEPKQDVSRNAPKLNRSLALRKSTHYQFKTGTLQQRQLEKSPTLAFWGNEEQESHKDPEHGRSKLHRSQDYIVEGVSHTKREPTLRELGRVRLLMERAISLLDQMKATLTEIGSEGVLFHDLLLARNVTIDDILKREHDESRSSSSASGGNTERQKREEERGPGEP